MPSLYIRFGVVAALALAMGCGDADTDAELCADRTDGALITFFIVGERFTVWITDDAFIDEALEHEANGTARVPAFLMIFDGQDCDEQWTFYPDPAAVEFADVTIEVCDGKPSLVEADKEAYLDLGTFCPWLARVWSVDDRR